MKKVIRLTESDLTRIVKRVIKENRLTSPPNENVRKLMSLLTKNNLIDLEYVNVYQDYIEVYKIIGCDSGYFMDNFIRLHPEDIDNDVVYVDGEHYGEEIDEEEYEEVLEYIIENWEPLLNLEFVE
jgi:hypothetical protein